MSEERKEIHQTSYLKTLLHSALILQQLLMLGGVAIKQSWLLNITTLRVVGNSVKLGRNTAMNYNDKLTVINLHCVGLKLILVKVLEFTMNKHWGSSHPPGWLEGRRMARSMLSGNSPFLQARGVSKMPGT